MLMKFSTIQTDAESVKHDNSYTYVKSIEID